MAELIAIAIFPKIPSENLSNFKFLANQLLDSVEKLESVVEYQIYFSQDFSRCTVLEKYSSPQGVIDHVNINGALIDELQKLGGKIEGSMFTLNLEDETIRDISESWDTVVNVFFQGKRK